MLLKKKMTSAFIYEKPACRLCLEENQDVLINMFQMNPFRTRQTVTQLSTIMVIKQCLSIEV